MQLSKRVQNKPEPKPDGNLSRAQKELLEPDWDIDIPRGKYQGKTLREVKKIDESYIDWVLREQVYINWGLYKVNGEKMVRKHKEGPKWDKMVWSNGDIVLGIREEVTATGTAVPKEWLQK